MSATTATLYCRNRTKISNILGLNAGPTLRQSFKLSKSGAAFEDASRPLVTWFTMLAGEQLHGKEGNGPYPLLGLLNYPLSL